ncbi:MAG: hypothetical protein QOE70_598 [Chthoniobacter sp.]|jgi:aminopeptidase N|nr:hypothetical protein [Chthoniobacter sp.]
MRAAFVLAVLAACLFRAHAEEPFAFEKTPGKLPKDVVPREYEVRIAPHLQTRTFQGAVVITIEVLHPVSRIVLNSLGLEIESRKLVSPAGDIALPAPEIDVAQQTLTFTLTEPLPAGSYRLELHFAGQLGEQPQGLFLTRYKIGQQERYALATQMEATDARRMFPCWDEPVFRASFQLSLEIPVAFTAVSNMPIAGEEAPPGAEIKRVIFAKTPLMPTYLVALFAGELEWLEDQVDGVKLRVLTATGKREQARYALEATKQILPFYNDYFGTKYPLPKLDQIAFPSTGASGMENWGAILYDETALLYDPAHSAQSTRERVFGVVAHEIAHQWFGDLVTMAWWDNLWLNEGFASWMGTKAMDKFNPDWQVWLRASGEKEGAMSLDARATTHPIQQRVETESQANDAFDEITYSKGQAFLRMLESYLGEQPFRDGIRQYVQRHAFSSTTTADLWKALEEVSGKPVRSLAAGWTEQPGFPVVKLNEVREAGMVAVAISQERFTLNQSKPEPLFWAIPITLGPAAAPLAAEVVLLKDRQMPPRPIEPGLALKANIGDVGYYRVWYDDALFKRLRKAAPLMATADRLNLLNDAWAMALAERAPVARYLELASALGDDPSYVIVDQILGTLSYVDRLQRGQPGEKAFHEWARRVLRPHLARLGWEPKPNEKQLDALLRSHLISTLGRFGDESVLAEARRRFETFLENPDSLPGDLREAVLGLAGRQADAVTWEKLRERGKAENSTEQKHLFYRALASARVGELAARTLAISLTDELVPKEATRLVRQVGDAGEQPELALEFARANLDPLLAKLGSLEATGFVPSLFRPFNDAARAAELERFAKDKLPPESAPQVARVADEIRLKASLKERLLPDIDAWCRAQPGK